MRLGELVAILGEMPVLRDNVCAPRDATREELASTVKQDHPRPRRSSYRRMRLPAVTRSG